MSSAARSDLLAKHKYELESWTYGNSLRYDLQHVASVIAITCRDLGIEIPIVVGGAAVPNQHFRSWLHLRRIIEMEVSQLKPLALHHLQCPGDIYRFVEDYRRVKLVTVRVVDKEFRT